MIVFQIDGPLVLSATLVMVVIGVSRAPSQWAHLLKVVTLTYKPCFSYVVCPQKQNSYLQSLRCVIIIRSPLNYVAGNISCGNLHVKTFTSIVDSVVPLLICSYMHLPCQSHTLNISVACKRSWTRQCVHSTDRYLVLKPP